MIAYKIAWHGYSDWYKQVTHTYKIVLKNGSDLYFTTKFSDFVGLENLTSDNFLAFMIEGNKGLACTDYNIFKLLLELNKNSLK